MDPKQLNTLSSLVLAEGTRCYKEARIAKSYGWPETAERWYTRAGEMRDIQGKLHGLKEEPHTEPLTVPATRQEREGCIHPSTLLSDEGHECAICGKVLGHSWRPGK